MAQGRLDWTQDINFASALLLHSCATVLFKEFFNLLTFLWRYTGRKRDRYGVATSFTVDGFTSIVSGDSDGVLSELYFTNTGAILLAATLASSVVMNLYLSDTALNVVVTATFGIALLGSLSVLRWRIVMPILALRRAGRFIWSDTPIVNFFSLIYIATVRHGNSTLQLKDYMIFRSIAIVELVFMKVLLAASNSDEQQSMLKALAASEKILMSAKGSITTSTPARILERRSILAFTTVQRMSVMFFKTSPGFDLGSVRAKEGPVFVPVPSVGAYIDETNHGWQIYRLSEDMMCIADNLQATPASGFWVRFIAHAHGVILRQLGKVRVVYLLRETRGAGLKDEVVWRSNINLVTGVSRTLLQSFTLSETGLYQTLV